MASFVSLVLVAILLCFILYLIIGEKSKEIIAEPSLELKRLRLQASLVFEFGVSNET